MFEIDKLAEIASSKKDIDIFLQIIDGLSTRDKYFLGILDKVEILDLVKYEETFKRDSIIKIIESGNSYLVVYDDTDIVAIYGLIHNELEFIVVLPKYRHKGIARWILEKNRRLIRYIRIKKDNKKMISLVESLGYIHSGNSMDGSVLHYKRIEKKE